MYEIIKAVIQSGNFNVSDITTKIDTLWAEGKLSDEEKQDLAEMMIEFINPNSQAPELKELYLRLKERVDALEKEVAELKGTGGTDPDPDVIVVPKWSSWDGISSNYQTGAVVEHNGKYYLNVLEGMQNTWEPDGIGVDERYWKEVTKEEAEAILKGES